MDLEKIVLNQCSNVENIPINNLESLDIKFCLGKYLSSKGKEIPTGYIELKLTKYNFSDYKEISEAILIVKNNKRFNLVLLKGEIGDFYDVITKPNEAKIIDAKEILSNSEKLRRMKSNLFYSINKFFSDYKILHDDDNIKEREIEVLGSLKYFLKEPYKKAIVEYL